MIIENGVSYMVRGDDETITVTPMVVEDPFDEDEVGTEYEMQSNDYLVLTVRKLPSAESPVLLQVTGLRGSNSLRIPHNLTAELEVGKYSMDIELMIGGVTRRTIWPDWSQVERYKRSRIGNIENFVLMPEVTM